VSLHIAVLLYSSILCLEIVLCFRVIRQEKLELLQWRPVISNRFTISSELSSSAATWRSDWASPGEKSTRIGLCRFSTVPLNTKLVVVIRKLVVCPCY
jgi:hypothetical protein